jgi:N-acetylglutamate synthase-like GNAT family acetyltransferase
VRQARKNDATSLSAFFIKAWRQAGRGALGFTGATDDAIKTISSEEFLLRRLTSPNVKIMIAARDSEVRGFASVRTIRKGEAELSGIVVLESASHAGLGTRLIAKACESAVKLGFKRLIVKTEAFNVRAIGFYKENGFTESTKTTEKVGGVKVPLLILERKLQRSPAYESRPPR